MNCLWQARWWLAFCAAGQCLTFQLLAETATNVPAPVQSSSVFSAIMPPLPPSSPSLRHSPVDLFRQLLAMTPPERKDSLTNRPPEIRTRILAKVREYQALGPDERELRLRATELRWCLVPFLRESPTNRATRLAAVPEDLRDLVKARLMQWDILPLSVRQELIQNERALRYFSQVDSTNGRTAPEYALGRRPQDSDMERWNALSADERKRITDQFNRFFELTPQEKQKTLNTLSDAERRQMEKTLETFDKLPPLQRSECIQAYTKFAGMSPADRAEFLKNAERWSQMSPTERQAWRDLVRTVPQWPPMPILPPAMPPSRIPGKARVHPAVATNQ